MGSLEPSVSSMELGEGRKAIPPSYHTELIPIWGFAISSSVIPVA